MATIELVFRPGVSTEVEIDEGNLLFYAAPRAVDQIPDQTRIVEEALENPIGTAKLEELLQPGDRVEIDHEVKVGSNRWHTTTKGTVVRTVRRRRGLHFDRNFDDGVFSDIIVLSRDDGELTTVALDEFSVLKRIEDSPA